MALSWASAMVVMARARVGGGGGYRLLRWWKGVGDGAAPQRLWGLARVGVEHVLCWQRCGEGWQRWAGPMVRVGMDGWVRRRQWWPIVGVNYMRSYMEAGAWGGRGGREIAVMGGGWVLGRIVRNRPHLGSPARTRGGCQRLVQANREKRCREEDECGDGGGSG